MLDDFLCDLSVRFLIYKKILQGELKIFNN